MSHVVSHNVMLTVPLVLSECGTSELNSWMGVLVLSEYGTSELNSWMGVPCTVREILC